MRLTGWGNRETEYRLSPAALTATLATGRRRIAWMTAIQREPLDDLHYEVNQWLWEVVWALNSRYPRVALTDNVQADKTAVRDLLTQKSSPASSSSECRVRTICLLAPIMSAAAGRRRFVRGSHGMG